MSESQIRALFAQIADGEPVPSRVDVQLAHRRGRARLRWRRACVAGASVVAAAAVAALAVGVGPARPGPGPVAAGGRAAPSEPQGVLYLARSAGCRAARSLVSGGTAAAVSDRARSPVRCPRSSSCLARKAASASSSLEAKWK